MRLCTLSPPFHVIFATTLEALSNHFTWEKRPERLGGLSEDKWPCKRLFALVFSPLPHATLPYATLPYATLVFSTLPFPSFPFPSLPIPPLPILPSSPLPFLPLRVRVLLPGPGLHIKLPAAVTPRLSLRGKEENPVPCFSIWEVFVSPATVSPTTTVPA